MSLNAPKSENRYKASQFKGKKRFCDVVMKGGVTSGVVYPLAVVELATKYQLKNIGGTSAGAIAAALAAAAEFGRAKDGYRKLARLAEEVPKKLLSLFQPTPTTRPLFKMLLALVGNRPKWVKLAAAFRAVASGYWQMSLLGCAPGIALGVWAWLKDNHWGVCTAAVLVFLVGWCGALAVRLYRIITRQLPLQDFGLCPGLHQRGNPPEALTEWLADTIDEIAGQKEGDAKSVKPLTFGDLLGKKINLELMTTNLTAARPFRLPFDQNLFMFRKEEFEKLFPEHIVDWIVEYTDKEKNKKYKAPPGYLYLPPTKDLPVVVAVRMSVCFPLLLSAVPLYARDFTLKNAAEKELPQKCWFSDGGICSNFPIHFFDSVWPRWPTFGITLDRYQEDRHEERVHLPVDAGERTPPVDEREGIMQAFTPFDSQFGFFGAILNTFRVWRDNLQSALPGYRERIVHVRLDRDEGGLNLDMPATLVTELSGYGRDAGARLLKEFDWDDHRWKRFVIWMAKLEETLERMNNSYTRAAPLDDNLKDFLARYRDNPKSYKQSQAWLHAAESDIEELMRCYPERGERTPLQDGDIPKPEVDLRLTPKV